MRFPTPSVLLIILVPLILFGAVYNGLVSFGVTATNLEQFNWIYFSVPDIDKCNKVKVAENDVLPLFPSPFIMNESFAACLMVKDDNELLYEWLAYHYTMLPLRYVVILRDSGSVEDPRDVLDRWNTTDLTYTIWNQPKKPVDMTHPVKARNQLVARQNLFIKQCSRHMRARNQTWVTHIDPDEYIVLNRINNLDKLLVPQRIRPTRIALTVRNTTVQQMMDVRKLIPPAPSDWTVLHLLKTAAALVPLGPCLTMPRVRVGALENVSCPEFQEAKATVQRNGIDYSRMTSLRFVQQSTVNDIRRNKWGKVMVDVSQLSNASLVRLPLNVHQPFLECSRPIALSVEALVYANHYIGTFEQYAGRGDARRSQKEWESHAIRNEANSCGMGYHEWFNRFIQLVGMEKANILLGI